VTTVFIVGTVCSAATGRALPGATISVDLETQSCAEGHQPWRCDAGAVADGQGHYGAAVYDAGDYRVTVRLAGFQSGGGTVHVAQPAP
jgi:hypothetical protein